MLAALSLGGNLRVGMEDTLNFGPRRPTRDNAELVERAARLAQEAQRYASDIQLVSDTGEVDAKSMLDILSLAPPANAELTLVAQGDDAREALCGLAQFLTNLQD